MKRKLLIAFVAAFLLLTGAFSYLLQFIIGVLLFPFQLIALAILALVNRGDRK